MKKSKFISKMKHNPTLKITNNSVINLPSPMNINSWWNFGSILGVYLMIQVISGIFLSLHYCPNINMAFESIIHIMKDVNMGWLIRLIHMNGASLYFISLYLHVGRGIYYHSFKSTPVWIMGVIIMLMSMATAFLGYVLPWGQMSFWGATVITNLLSAIPYIGQMMVEWIWGGFSIDNATLNRFYSFHFILPLIIMILVILHLFFLHLKGSNNPLGTNSNKYKIPFHSYFTIKDMLGFILIFFIHFLIIMQYPYTLGDPDNFIYANSMSTPAHIKPEWYFLFAYSILRAIPNKLGGVIGLVMSILILMILPFTKTYNVMSSKFYPTNQLLFWSFVSLFNLLTWSGGKQIEYPYKELSQIFTMLYFSYFIINPNMNKYWDSLIYKF
uniref:Cytochrome b n=1 Tax=Andrena chekiangensis TaxID=2572772 RepID=A0A4D6STM6_9HYME|nr:cytochrome b [Andrena chekiangensis]QCG69821.1 cytochrome b [Andrena chekiangensis]